MLGTEKIIPILFPSLPRLSVFHKGFWNALGILAFLMIGLLIKLRVVK